MRKTCSIRGAALAFLLVASGVFAQDATPVLLDKVVAVVNKHVILASDLDDEIRLSILDATQLGQGQPTRERALEQLISRTLVEQQIGDEDTEASQPTAEDIKARVNDLRRELPACVNSRCDTEAGWKTFLDAHGLTEESVEAYLRYRLTILQFIERRFRPGIRIPQDQVEAYYNVTLIPQYAAGEPVPPLDKVAPRIEEILLEQQVNVLFDQWLDNLRRQGDVEVVDQTLAPQLSAAGAAKPENSQ
jgi:peptidyl-prolyl cis-trans isomerase SurA